MSDSLKSSKNQQELHINQARRNKIFLRTTSVVVALLIITGVIGALIWYQKRRLANLPGVYYPSAGNEHILNATPPRPYNSNPPSSGAHFSQPANWGVYDYEVNDKIFIHNLEHGGIWIAYRPQIPPQALETLKSIVNDFGGLKIVMAPRSQNDADVAIVAWTRVLKFNLTNGAFTDEQKNQVREFYRDFKDRGPEFVPDTMPGIDPKSVQ